MQEAQDHLLWGVERKDISSLTVLTGLQKVGLTKEELDQVVVEDFSARAEEVGRTIMARGEGNLGS